MAKGIERSTISYTLEYTNKRGKQKTKKLKIRTFSNRPLLDVTDSDVPDIELAGYAQGRRVLKKAVRARAEQEGIYAVGVHLPLLRLPRNHNAIEKAITDIPRFVADILRGNSQEKVFGIGQSLGASVLAVAGAAASESPETNPFGDMLLLQPAVMKKLVKEPADTRDKAVLKRARKEYMGRFMKNKAPLRVRKDLKATYDNVKTIVDAGARIVYDAVVLRLKPQFNFAITRSTSEAIKKYVDNTGYQVVVPLGAQDPVSPLRDANIGLIAAGAKPDNPTVIVIDNVVHTTPHLPQGLRSIKEGLAVFEAKGRPIKRYERRPPTRPERKRWRRRSTHFVS